MERYSEYRDSGVFWQTIMPKDWNVLKIRYVLSKLQRVQTPNSDLLICSNSGKVTKRGDNKLGLVAENNDIYQGVKEGDLLIHGMDTWHGAIAVSAYDGMCTPVVHVCDSDNNKAFIAYYLRNMATSKVFKLISNGVRQNTSDFRSWEKLATIPVILPPLPEQHSIVSFLDSKCSKIDEWISKKQIEVELLGEAKQRIIADAVTRGLNPNVKMKKTDIAWLKEVPEHWEVRRLKNLFNQRSESYNPNEKLQVLSLLKDVGVIPYSEKGNIGNKAKEDYSSYNVTRKGDIVMNSMNVIIGSVDITAYDGYISPAYYALYAKEGVCTEYYNYIFHMKAVQKHMRSLANGILEIRLRISTTNLFGMNYPVPPLSEQRAIVSYINTKTSKIDSLMSSMNKEIEHLKEYRQRLISDVVTGQIKV